MPGCIPVILPIVFVSAFFMCVSPMCIAGKKDCPFFVRARRDYANNIRDGLCGGKPRQLTVVILPERLLVVMARFFYVDFSSAVTTRKLVNYDYCWL